jgi:hypothetical protein
VTVERDRHRAKHFWQSFVTREGIQIDESDEQPSNAEYSMIESAEPDSNVTAERDSHPEKQFRDSFRTEAGMQMDEIDGQL